MLTNDPKIAGDSWTDLTFKQTIYTVKSLKVTLVCSSVEDNCRQWDIQEDYNARPGHQLKKNLLWQNCVSHLFIITSAPSCSSSASGHQLSCLT